MSLLTYYSVVVMVALMVISVCLFGLYKMSFESVSAPNFFSQMASFIVLGVLLWFITYIGAGVSPFFFWVFPLFLGMVGPLGYQFWLEVGGPSFSSKFERPWKPAIFMNWFLGLSVFLSHFLPWGYFWFSLFVWLFFSGLSALMYLRVFRANRYWRDLLGGRMPYYRFLPSAIFFMGGLFVLKGLIVKSFALSTFIIFFLDADTHTSKLPVSRKWKAGVQGFWAVVFVYISWVMEPWAPSFWLLVFTLWVVFSFWVWSLLDEGNFFFFEVWKVHTFLSLLFIFSLGSFWLMSLKGGLEEAWWVWTVVISSFFPSWGYYSSFHLKSGSKRLWLAFSIGFLFVCWSLWFPFSLDLALFLSCIFVLTRLLQIFPES